jgi:hypothetical protein
MPLTWKETDEKTYWYMLEVLPPAVMTRLGFLVGEPLDHATCPVTGKFGPRFEAYAKVGGKFFVGSLPMSVGGFKTVTAKDLYPKTVKETG